MPRIDKKFKAPITGQEFGKLLIDAGIILANGSRTIIDIPADGVVTIYTSVFAKYEDLDVLFKVIQKIHEAGTE